MLSQMLNLNTSTLNNCIVATLGASYFYIFLENSVENRMFVNVITSGRTVNLRNYLHLLHRSSYTPLTRLTKQTN